MSNGYFLFSGENKRNAKHVRIRRLYCFIAIIFQLFERINFRVQLFYITPLYKVERLQQMLMSTFKFNFIVLAVTFLQSIFFVFTSYIMIICNT